MTRDRLGAMAAQFGFWVMVICTAALTVAAVRQQFFPHRVAGREDLLTAPVPVRNWNELTAIGHRRGAVDARVVILEFSDFECPACREYNLNVLPAIQASFPGQVAILYRHWPLTRMHKFAYPAARASECVAQQGRFWNYHDLVFQKQDSLGLKPFEEYAKESGVADIALFRTCDARREPVAAIDADIAAAQKAGGGGTPTLIVNGFVFRMPPDSAKLDSIVRVAVRRRS